MLAFGLSSCVMDGADNGAANGNGETTTAFMKITGITSASRAQGAPVANGSAAVFTSGKLVFTGDNDVALHVLTINATGDFDEVNKTVGLNVLRSGVNITGIPTASTRAYFIGNPPAAAVIGLDANVKTMKTTLEDQYNNGAIDKVVLFNTTSSSMLSKTNPDLWTANLDVRPLAARIEIPKITDKNTGVQYVIEGIFISNYYEDMTLMGTSEGGQKNWGSAASVYVGGNSASYRNNLSGIVYDYVSTGLSLTAGKVWAYNVLAPNPGLMPSITVRMHNPAKPTEPKFIAINQYFKDANKTVPLVDIEGGKVYVIGGSNGISFTSIGDVAADEDKVVIAVDSNGDGKIDDNDEPLIVTPGTDGEIVYYVDENGDGKPDESEKKTTTDPTTIDGGGKDVFVDTDGDGEIATDEDGKATEGVIDGGETEVIPPLPPTPPTEPSGATLSVTVDVKTWAVEDVYYEATESK